MGSDEDLIMANVGIPFMCHQCRNYSPASDGNENPWDNEAQSCQAVWHMIDNAGIQCHTEEYIGIFLEGLIFALASMASCPYYRIKGIHQVPRLKHIDIVPTRSGADAEDPEDNQGDPMDGSVTGAL